MIVSPLDKALDQAVHVELSFEVLVFTSTLVLVGVVALYVNAPQTVSVSAAVRLHDRYVPVVVPKLYAFIQSSVRSEPDVVVLFERNGRIAPEGTFAEVV